MNFKKVVVYFTIFLTLSVLISNKQSFMTYGSGKKPKWGSDTGNLEQSNKYEVAINTNLKFSRILCSGEYKLDMDRYRIPRVVIDSENNLICAVGEYYIGKAYIIKVRPDGHTSARYESGLTCGPCLTDDDLVIFGYKNILYCLNKRLELNWTYTCDEDIDDSLVISNDGDLIFKSNNTIYCLNKFGKKQWYNKISTTICSRFCIDPNNNIIFSTNKSEVYSISKAGKQNWKKTPNGVKTGFIYNSKVSLAKDGSIFCLSGGNLTKWDKNAKLQWAYSDENFGITTGNSIKSAADFYIAVKDENTVVVKSQYHLTQIKNGKKDWKIDNLNLSKDSIPIVDINNRLFVIDAFTQGNTLGYFKDETYSTIYIVEDNGQWKRYKQEKIKGYFDPGEKYPIALENGDLLIGNNLHLFSEKKLTMILLSIGSEYCSVDCNVFELDAPPFIFKNRTVVPIRFIAETFGGIVDWNNMLRTITINFKKRNLEIELSLEKNSASINGKQVNLDVQPIIEKGRTFVPIRFIGEAIGCKVEWIPNGEFIKLTLEE